MWNLLFLFSSMLFIILLMIIFKSKERMGSKENKIFYILSVENLISYVSEILLQIFVRNLGAENILSVILAKIYVICIFIWFSIFSIYTFYIILKSKKNIKEHTYDIIKKFHYIIIGIGTIVLSAVPIEIYYNSDAMYSYGPSVNILKLMLAIYLIVWFVKMLYNYNLMKQKKYFPIYTTIVLLILNVILQTISPEILIATYTMTFTCYVIFFTIENPDLKLIRELELAKNTAEKANRAKSDFLSSMSHEIRTPLNAIVGLSEVIKNSDDIEEIHEDANDVVMASQNLLEIVNGILDISKIEADKMEIVETNYNPIEVFNELTTLVETRIGEKEIELRCNFAEDIPNALYGDKGKLKQIITNMLSNAVKYTEKGHINFSVSCINEKDKSKLQIIISDTGRGIKPDQMDTIFNKFERAEEDKNSTIEGTGLGLAITKSLVEMMGGKILVHSTYGEGSKFTVFLEQNYSKNEENVKVIKDEKISYSDKKVLIVDDNKLNIKVASKILSEFELNIDSCDSGFSAIEKIENNEHYDIILMDIMMPKMSGVETLKKLKQIDNFNTPVVALTADAMEGKSTKYIEVGFNDYLSKPINKEELKRVLNKCLNGNIEIVEEKTIEEDPDIHKVIPITDEDIEELNRLVAEKENNN